MVEKSQNYTVRVLRWSEKYFKTDMVYLASGGFWLLFGQVGALVFSLGLAIIFGHYAAQDTYGNYKYIISLSSLLGIFSLSGLSTAVTRSAARGDEGALRQGFALNIRYGAGIVVSGLIASAYYFYTGNTFAAVGLALAAVTLPFINGFSLYDSFLTGLKEFRLDALYSLGSLAFTTIALGITLLFFSQRAIILVAVYFITNLASDALWYMLSNRRVRNTKNDPEMLTYGFHLSLMSVIGAIADKIDSIVIFSFLGPVQLAVYSFAIAIPEQIKAVVKNIVPLSMPKFAQRSIADIKETIWGRVLLLGIAITATVAVYILIAPFLFRYLFPVYLDSVTYSQFYALSLIMSFITPLSSVFQAHKKTKELYIFSNVPAVIIIISLPILTYMYGIAGAVGSQILYRMATAATALFLFWRMED